MPTIVVTRGLNDKGTKLSSTVPGHTLQSDQYSWQVG